MKKIFLFLMLAAPVAAFSQSTPQSLQAPVGREEKAEATPNRGPESYFCELIVGTNGAGGEAIRIDFGKDIMKESDDKEFLSQVAEARNMKFSTVVDAFQYLSNMGYKFVTSYTSGFGERGENHMIFEKKAMKGGRPNIDRPTRPTNPQKPVVDDKAPAGGTKTPTPSKTPEKGKK